MLAALIISLFWYLPGVILQGKNRALTNKQYLWSAFVAGLLFTCVLIVVTELCWDEAAKMAGLKGFAKEMVGSFFRAALLEELFKYLGFMVCLDKFRKLELRKIDYVMLAGMVSMVYGIFEKLLLGGPASLISSLVPMHMMWQFNQGGHYYEYRIAKEAGDKKKVKKELFFVIAVPFLFHGTWDAVITLSSEMLDMKSAPLIILGICMIPTCLVLGIMYVIKTYKWVKQLAKKSAEDLAENKAGVTGGDKT